MPTVDRITDLLIDECQRYYDTFQSFSGIAKYQFEKRHWHDQRKANIRRLDLVDQHRDYCNSVIREWLSGQDANEHWARVKENLNNTPYALPKPILRSFILSVERSLFPLISQTKDYREVFFDEDKESQEVIQLTAPDLSGMARKILLSPRLNTNFADLISDIESFKTALLQLDGAVDYAEIFPNLFYRNKHAYLIGRIWLSGRYVPLGVAFINNENGIRADAFFFKEEELIRVFEFTRSYILTVTKDPEGLFAFLKKVMPRKNIDQLIVNLGYREWGKALMQRAFEMHVRNHNISLTHAPGIKGMVMQVFTTDSYPMVFKLIRDNIAYPKETTPKKVLEKYNLVARHDRVGRLADTQLFQFWCLPQSAFDKDFLKELTESAGSSVRMIGDELILQRVFTERKMIPLNLYLESMSKSDAEEVIIDYGRAIKDLAMSNIFPGDLLPKNFGVTTENRVVFYDYDEVVLLTDCTFRKLPEPRNEEELWDAETWTVARENDIFPEELEKFIIPPPYRELFRTHHGDLFEPDFWNHWKKFHEMEGFIDLQPY